MRFRVPGVDRLTETVGGAYDRLIDGLLSVTAGIGQRSERSTENASGWLARLLRRVDREPGVALVGGLTGAWLVLAPVTGHHGATYTLPAAGLLWLAALAPTAGLTAMVAMVTFLSPVVLTSSLGYVGYAPALAFAILLGCLIRLLLEGPILTARLVPLAITFYGMASLFAYLRLSGLPGADVVSGFAQLLEIGAGLAILLSAIYLGPRMGRGVIYAAVLVAGSVAAIMGLITWSPDLLTTFGNSTFLRTTEFTGRAFGPFLYPNYYGVYVAMIFVFIVAWPAGPSSRWWWIPRLVAGLFVGTAVMLSMTRGAVLAAELGLVLLAFQRGRKAGLVGLVAAAVFLVVIFPSYIDWRLSITYGPNLVSAHEALDQSTSWRLDTVVAGLNLFRRDPILGVGLGQFHVLSPQYLAPGVGITYSHNLYVNVLAEQGLTGFSALILMLLGIGWTLLRSSATAAAGTLTVFSVFLLSCLTVDPTDLQTSGIFWVLLGLGLASAFAAGNRDWSSARRGDVLARMSWKRAQPDLRMSGPDAARDESSAVGSRA